MMRELGGVFGLAILVAVFSGAGSYAPPQEFTDGFAPALGVTAALSLVGALVGPGLPNRGATPAIPLTLATQEAGRSPQVRRS